MKFKYNKGPTSKDIISCDVLFINPPWVSKTQNIRSGMKHAMPPLSILSIAAYLESKGYVVQVIDVHVERLLSIELRKSIRRANPLWVGISFLTATSISGHQIAKIVKQECPKCRVVIGGVHAEAVPEETLSNSAVDFLISGDGEIVFYDLIKSGGNIDSVKGITYRKKNSIVKNLPAEVNLDLDLYPRPAYHLVPMHLYYPAIGAYKKLPAINMMMTRGCPGKCTFCNSANTTLRTRSAASVVDDIRYLKKTYGIQEIEFFDDTFTVMVKNVQEFCRLMIEANLGVVWTAYIRADCFNKKMGEAMKKAGCHQVLIGVESGNEKVLELLRKPINFFKTKETVRIAQECGLDVRASFILGNVGETLESMEDSFEFAVDLNSELVNFHINTPYPGTQLYKWAKDNDVLVTDEWTEYELSTFLLNLSTISAEQVFSFYKKVHGRYFLRWGPIKTRLKRIQSLQQLTDTIKALFYVILRLKPHKSSRFANEWSMDTKSDYFDIPINLENSGTTVTWEIRQGPMNSENKDTALELYKVD